ncbi:hypothetical protein BAE44_0001042, partial [Dichanthelium oligosanthes]
LLVQQRIQCRSNLLKKNVIAEASCELCWGLDEDCHHLIFTCPFAMHAWRALGIDGSAYRVAELWTVRRPTTVPAKHFDSFLLLVCWQLWKHRNEVVFRNAPASHTRLWMACKEDARLWSCRWPRTDRTIADAWCRLFTPM